MNYQVVIPAAGQGKRMNAGKNKQFLEVNEIPLIIHTLRVFESHSLCSGIILVINKMERNEFEELIHKYKITKVKQLVYGGAERQNSVYNGLKACHKENYVLVHDGARPFVSHTSIEELIQATNRTGAATLGVPLKDTIKVVKDGVVSHTLDRSNLWGIQTPQAFELDLILNAHNQAIEEGYLGTDDASLMERTGQAVSIVMGDYINIKITTPEDLIIAESIIKRK